MARLHILLAATAFIGLGSAGAMAQDPVRVTNQGENFSVQYAPGYRGNVVGGGASPRVASGDATQAEYGTPVHENSAPGFPTFEGGNEGNVVYLPTMTPVPGVDFQG